MVDDETKSGSADNVGELLERQWPEDFVLDLDKLWYLKSHFNLTPRDTGQRSIFSLSVRSGSYFAVRDLRVAS